VRSFAELGQYQYCNYAEVVKIKGEEYAQGLVERAISFNLGGTPPKGGYGNLSDDMRGIQPWSDYPR
jgi:hypothetical protein